MSYLQNTLFMEFVAPLIDAYSVRQHLDNKRQLLSFWNYLILVSKSGTNHWDPAPINLEIKLIKNFGYFLTFPFRVAKN